jgi:predicted transcriptional regulator
MENWPIKHPSSGVEPGAQGEEALRQLFDLRGVQPHVQEWYRQIERGLHEWNEEIWTNIGQKYIGVYSPEKAFVSIECRPTSLRIECFSRGEPLEGARVSNVRSAPRWAVFTVKAADQVEAAIDSLKESHGRLKAAMRAGEPTAYFSGGTRPGGSEETTSAEEAP